MIHTYNLLDFATRYGLQDHALFDILCALPGNHWIAGGALRAFVENKPITTDIDYFFPSDAAYKEFADYLVDDKVTETDSVTTFKTVIGGVDYKIQAINLAVYPDIPTCLDSFDFTLCMLGTDGKTLYAGEYTLFDIARKHIVVNKITYAAASVRRLLKYASQGYTACQGCIVQMLDAVADDPAIIQASVAYVD